jgi:RimJ/RimL family protein N-acetyltransferase
MPTKKIADVTANIPHPYLKDLANEWISTHSQTWNSRERASYAITLSGTGLLVGCIALMDIGSGEGELVSCQRCFDASFLFFSVPASL